MALPLARRRFTVEEYERMVEAGILHEDDLVELLEGEVVERAPIGPRHASCVKRLLFVLTSRLGDGAVVSVQDPVRLGPYSEPQPDVAVLRARPDFYGEGHPEADDVLLVVEVSASTAHYDRAVKLALYGRAGIGQAWLVDLDENVVEVYRLAAGGSYGEPELVTGEARLVLDAFPDVALTAADILG